MVKTELVEYKLSRDLSDGEMRSLYLACLKKDKKWHFFHEGAYAVVRTSTRNEKLETWCESHSISFTVSDWRDYPIVEKYREIFMQIFHGFSVLAMERSWEPEYADEWQDIRDRVLHSFFVMNGIRWDAECKQLSNALVDRMIYTISQYTLALVKDKAGEAAL